MKTEIHITREEAVEAARAALTGKVNLPADASAEVELKNGVYTVVFPWRVAQNVLGPDYHAKVTVDAERGEVLEILAGS